MIISITSVIKKININGTLNFSFHHTYNLCASKWQLPEEYFSTRYRFMYYITSKAKFIEKDYETIITKNGKYLPQ